MANGKKDPPKSIGKAIVNTLLDPFEVSKSIDKINPVENIYEMGKKFYAPITNLFGKEEDAKQATKGGITKSAPKPSPKSSSTVYIGKPRPTGTTKQSTPIKGGIDPLPKQKADPHPINKKMENTYTEKFQNPRHDLIEGDKNL
tara:strand:+ start:2409 stop:2840 length:432 start_codon:yes stop_codon:yes gene_type:complete